MPGRHLGNDLKVHILLQLHVLGMYAQHLQAPRLVRHADVDLAVEAPEAPQGRIHTAAAQHTRVSCTCTAGLARSHMDSCSLMAR